MDRTSTVHTDMMNAIITDAIKLAFPDSRVKRLAVAIGCSFMTAKRIRASGKVSQAYRRQLLDVLDEELARNELAIRRLRAELRGHPSHEETNRVVSENTMGALPTLAQGYR